jgi:hypothetical protein
MSINPAPRAGTTGMRSVAVGLRQRAAPRIDAVAPIRMTASGGSSNLIRTGKRWATTTQFRVCPTAGSLGPPPSVGRTPQPRLSTRPLIGRLLSDITQTVAGSPMAISASSVSRKLPTAYQSWGVDQGEERMSGRGIGAFRNIEADHQAIKGRAHRRVAEVALGESNGGLGASQLCQ